MKPEIKRLVRVFIAAVVIGSLVTTVPAISIGKIPVQMPIQDVSLFDGNTGFNRPVRQNELLGGEAGGEQAMITCPEPRPQVCSQEYRPVCAQLEDGSFKTYSNGCTACSDTVATGYREGACE